MFFLKHGVGVKEWLHGERARKMVLQRWTCWRVID